METWSPVPEASWAARATGQLVAVSQDTEAEANTGRWGQGSFVPAIGWQRPRLHGSNDQAMSDDAWHGQQVSAVQHDKVAHAWGRFLSGFTLVPDPSQAGLGRVSWPLTPRAPTHWPMEALLAVEGHASPQQGPSPGTSVRRPRLTL